MTTKFSLTQDDWDQRLRGWHCDVVAIPGVQVERLFHNGVQLDPRTYRAEGNVIFWSGSERPSEIVVDIVFTRNLAKIDLDRIELERQRLELEHQNTELERERLALEHQNTELERERLALDQKRLRLEQQNAKLEREKFAVERKWKWTSGILAVISAVATLFGVMQAADLRKRQLPAPPPSAVSASAPVANQPSASVSATSAATLPASSRVRDLTACVREQAKGENDYRRFCEDNTWSGPEGCSPKDKTGNYAAEITAASLSPNGSVLDYRIADRFCRCRLVRTISSYCR